MKYLMMSNEGVQYEREVTQIFEELGNIGGLLEFAMVVGYFAYLVLVQPFRDLDLAINFNSMKDQICHQENIIKDEESLMTDFEKKLDCRFYTYWYCIK